MIFFYQNYQGGKFMEKALSTSKWIWYTDNFEANTYGDFFDEFNYDGGKVICNLSCDSDYTLWVNGEYIASNQYCDFLEYKIYDTIDITKYLNKGKNNIHILVWYWGVDTTRYYTENPGLIYEFICDNSIIAQSDITTDCRENPNYKSRYKKRINGFLGFSYLYDATLDSNIPCHKAVLCGKVATLYPRPIKKQIVLEKAPFKLLKSEPKHYVIDLEDEICGFFTFKFKSKCKQNIIVTWGEKLVDGDVERFQGGDPNSARDYSIEYVAKEGQNEYTNHMLRFAARYMSITSEEAIELEYCSIISQVYDVKMIEREFENPLDKKIWDICTRTLNVCMMEHYVDNPFREQNLYAYDSGVQMSCGYRVFENGNADYVRSNLLLFSKDKHDSEILSITSPCGPRYNGLAIPSYSLHYINSVREYMEETGDLSLGTEVYDKLVRIISEFIAQRKDKLVYPFDKYWNYYEWSEYMDESHFPEIKGKPHIVLNCLFIMALESIKEICKMISKEFLFDDILKESRPAVKEAFYNTENGLFRATPDDEGYTELGNAIAYLTGLTNGEESDRIINALISGELLRCTLSFKNYKYNALIKHNPKNKEFVINEIRETYKIMLDAGSTTVWETIDGRFGGSKCHGWSAVPILYLE